MNRLFPDVLLGQMLTGSEMLGAVLKRQPPLMRQNVLGSATTQPV